MINVALGEEPDGLKKTKSEKLSFLAALGRDPVSDDITGYRIVAAELWALQHNKCCYCEERIRFNYNDVEHYRPKARANRLPGCVEKHGYWWLAYSWENLIYACATCNRSNKNDKFPLQKGSIPLTYNMDAPGDEVPLLLNPAEKVNPVDHIKFIFEYGRRGDSKKYWWARPRDGSARGNATIDVCGLNDQDLLELRDRHYQDFLCEKIEDLNSALNDGKYKEILKSYRKALHMMMPSVPHTALAYDAFVAEVKNEMLMKEIGVGWPVPGKIGLGKLY
jgi:uncharacterized protein (TIGR02646 family)